MKSGLRVIKQGDTVFIRSRFSVQDDLVIRVGKGANGQINFSGAFLINASLSMAEKELTTGRLIHANEDDSTPWNINGTYIGANHGCSDMRQITCPGHGRNTADLGSAWEDETGARFYLIKIVDADTLWFLSENLGKSDIWKFKKTITGSSLKSKERRAMLNFTECKMEQLRPACRIKKQLYLINGKTPLNDGKPTLCDFFDIVEEYNIINPASLLEDIIKHPGKERDFAGGALAGVIYNHIVYRFHHNGANVIYYTAKALQDFNLGYMGFIQSARLTRGNYDTHEYYIPKTLPFTQDGVNYDFASLQDYSLALKSPLQFSAAHKNIADPNNLPDRFIQFLGRKKNGKIEREVGYALGYSIITGLTQPKERAKNAGTAITLHTTHKSYPRAIDSKMGTSIPAGTQFECIAYRHYFCPAAYKNATCFYWHEEKGETVVYADYHKAIEQDVLTLPSKLSGKPISVIEKTPSLIMHADNAAGGVVVSVKGDYGYVVFKIK